MPIQKEAKPLPSPLDYVPPDSDPYRVKRGDSWWSMIDLPGPRSKDMSANDLCYFNFKTRKGAEINWYLRNKVGCTHTTKSGDNYVFNGSDSPGVVYLPRVGAPLPVTEVDNRAGDTQIWVGLAVKGGATVGVAGNETLDGIVVSTDDVRRWMNVIGTVTRLGLGAGASGGVAVMIVGGVKRAADLNGHMQGEMDFNLAIGAKFGPLIKAALAAKAAKAAKGAARFKPLLNFMTKVGAKTPKGFRTALKDPEKIAELGKLVKNNAEAWGLQKNNPNVIMIDFPFLGVGTEVSFFHAVSEYHAQQLTEE